MVTGDSLHLGQIIKESGDFGIFQVLMLIHNYAVLLCLTWSMMAMAYTASVPGWICFASNETETWNETNACTINGASCDRVEFIGDMRTAVSEWSLVCDRKWISQTITTIQMSGILVGGLLCGHIADGVGRKPTRWIAYGILCVCNLASFFSVHWLMFAILRFGIGFGCACYMSTSLTSEYIRNKWRVYLNVIPGWALICSLLALFCWRVQNWRYIDLTSAVVAGAAILTWPVIPDSFRWLVASGRFEEAERVIAYVARINRKPVPDISRLRPALEFEQKEAEKIKTLRIYTVLDLFRTRRIRKTAILFAMVWLFSAYSYYGIAFAVQELSGSLYLNLFLINVVDIPSSFILVATNYWGGRRWTCVGFYIVSGIFGLAVGVIKHMGADVSGSTVNILALISKLCIAAAWNMNSIWSFEAFPTVVRQIGKGFISSVARIGSMIAPQIITLSKDIPGLLYILSGIVCGLSSLLCVFIDETKDRDLDDMIHDAIQQPGTESESFRTLNEKNSPFQEKIQMQEKL